MLLPFTDRSSLESPKWYGCSNRQCIVATGLERRITLGLIAALARVVTVRTDVASTALVNRQVRSAAHGTGPGRIMREAVGVD